MKRVKAELLAEGRVALSVRMRAVPFPLHRRSTAGGEGSVFFSVAAGGAALGGPAGHGWCWTMKAGERP